MQIKQNETEKLLIFLAFTIEFYPRRVGVMMFKHTQPYTVSGSGGPKNTDKHRTKHQQDKKKQKSVF